MCACMEAWKRKLLHGEGDTDSLSKKLTMRDIVGSVQISFVVFVEEVLALTSHNLQRELVPVVQLL